ncbi:hypothetical protein SDC9_80641 [bioreactor metagenome]|uniref:Uncharacterized protein n=1 Tax=bioreactor metagenome TaxID=1076179 RepID=A0A644YZN1_9ZZZZ
MLLEFLFHFGQALLAGGFLVQFGVDLLNARFDEGKALFGFVAAAGGLFFVFVPHIQPQNTGENAFAVRGFLGGELVRLTLQEKGGVGESLVIQAQGLADELFCVLEGGTGEHPPILGLFQDGKFQLGCLVPGFETLGAIAVAFVIEDQHHFCCCGMQVDDGVVAAARLAKKHPGDCIQQR